MKLQTRDVPDQVHKTLKHEAVDRGLSLNTLVIEILTKAAEKIEAAKAKGGKA
jgi:predicted HicB family RNase H-like nuclease